MCIKFPEIFFSVGKIIFNIVEGILFPYLLTHLYIKARFTPGLFFCPCFSTLSYTNHLKFYPNSVRKEINEHL